MVAITRAEVRALTDPLTPSKKKKKPDLVGFFLMLFEDGLPLQREAVEDWRDDVDSTPSAHIGECLEEALAEGWVEEKNSELFITVEGRKKAEDTMPVEDQIG